jgi:DNA-binding transcriptional regulator YiaG
MPRKIDGETNPIRAALMTRQGRAIGEARRAAGLTQPAAAVQFGVSASTVKAWEMGRRACPLVTRRRMVTLWKADGASLETADEICPHCGRPFELVSNSTRPKPAKRRSSGQKKPARERP